MTIKQIQHLLAYLGFYTGAVDGVWGQQSQKATIQFQKAFSSLTVDGIVGAETEKALRHAVCYGLPEMEEPEEETEDTGTFWDEIQYFSRENAGIRCPCSRCGGFPVEPTEQLMKTMEGIRRHFTELKGRDTPLNPTSTVRCQAHNDELPGSAKNSRHIQGRAMDFWISGVPVGEVIAYTRQLQQQGKIHYTYEMTGTGCVHVDV